MKSARWQLVFRWALASVLAVLALLLSFLGSGGKFGQLPLAEAQVTAAPPDQATAVAVDKAPAKVTQGQGAVLMMSLTISATVGTAPVSGIRIARTGAGSDGDVALVKVYSDDNGNGMLDVASDTRLGTASFVGGIANVPFDQGSLVSSPPLKLLITYDFAGNATPNDTVGAAISSASYISTTATVTGSFPMTSTQSKVYAAGTDFTPPSTPTGLTATARGRNMVSLSWNASTDNSGVVSYTVEISWTGTFTRPVYPGSNHAWVDVGLGTNTTYQYRVKAYDAAGNASGYSSIATATTSSTGLNPHASRSTLNVSCSVCHSIFGANNQKPRVDLLCYTCHDGTGSNYNPKSEFMPIDSTNAQDPGSTLTSYHKIHLPTSTSSRYNDVYCTRCHNNHGYVTPGPNYGVRLLKNPYTGVTTTEQFCYGCHSSTGDSRAYAFGGQISTTFSVGAHKSGPAADPTGSGNNIMCLNCHGPHASNNDNLVGRTTYTVNGSTKPISTASYATTYAGSKVCLSAGCHDSSRVSPNRGWNVYNQFMVSATQHSVITSTAGSSIGCSNCHGPHTVKTASGSTVSDPSNTINLASYGTGPQKAAFCKTCHDGSPPSFAMSSATIVPQTITFPAQTITTNNGGWNKVNYASGVGHYDKQYGCDRCHSPHGSDNPRLVTQPEDTSTTNGICLQCHNSGKVDGAPDLKTPLTRTYRHPTLYTSTKHYDTETLQNLPLSQRHAECADCHDPHQAQAGTHSGGSGNLGNVLRGISGVAVTNGTAWATPTYTALQSITEEYQLCVKCHTSYSWGSNPPTTPSGSFKMTDVGKEFNVNNGSYHWVENDKTASSGVTPRTNDGRNMTFKSGTPWTRTSKMNCSDCHASDQSADAKGPHGSNQPFIVSGTWSATTYGLCTQCHDSYTYTSPMAVGSPSKTGFSNSSENLHALHVGQKGRDCSECHSTVPHGGNATYTFSNGTYTVRALLEPIKVGGNAGSKTGGTAVSNPPYTNNSKLWIGTWANSGQWSQSYCAFWTGYSWDH